MKKIITTIAALAATLMLTGCGEVSAPEFKNPVPIIVVEPTTAVATTEPTMPEATIPATEPNFEIGDDVYIVLHADDYAPASVFEGVLIAQTKYYAIVSPYYAEDKTDKVMLMWYLYLCSDDEQACLYLFDINDCYSSREEAQAVVDAEMEAMNE